MKHSNASAVEAQISALLNQEATAESLNQAGVVELSSAHYAAHGAWCQEQYEAYLDHIMAWARGSVVTSVHGVKTSPEVFMREIEAHMAYPVPCDQAPRFRTQVLACAAEFVAPPYSCHVELGRAIERYVQIFTLRALVAGVQTHRL